MFQFRRKKTVPLGPYELVSQIEIKRAVSAVYPLLDLADPRHAKRQLDDRVVEAPDQPGTFHLVIKELPDAVFTLTVTTRTSNREYGFACVSTPRFGNVARSHEHYALEELDSNNCRLILTNRVEFDRKMSEGEFQLESLMLALANESALEKIKVHAEEGVDAVKALWSGVYLDPGAGGPD